MPRPHPPREPTSQLHATPFITEGDMGKPPWALTPKGLRGKELAREASVQMGACLMAPLSRLPILLLQGASVPGAAHPPRPSTAHILLPLRQDWYSQAASHTCLEAAH